LPPAPPVSYVTEGRTSREQAGNRQEKQGKGVNRQGKQETGKEDWKGEEQAR